MYDYELDKIEDIMEMIESYGKLKEAVGYRRRCFERSNDKSFYSNYLESSKEAALMGDRIERMLKQLVRGDL